MTFAIRPLHPADNPSIAAIIRQVLTEFGANRPGFAWADPELDTLSRAYQKPGAAYYVITHAENVTGGGGIAPFACEYPDLCELQKMYLLPDFRGKGLGQRLMETLLKTAQANRYQGCYLETFDAFHAAIALYEKYGFERLAQPLGDSGHTSYNLFFLRRFSQFAPDLSPDL